MTNKLLSTTEIKTKSDFYDSKWSLWYTYNEILWEPPSSAPDWVKPAWVPIPQDYPVYGKSQSIECHPNGGILCVDGPVDGKIMPPNPNSSQTLVVNSGPAVIGTYTQVKQSWSHLGYHYWRIIYEYKPKYPKFEPKKAPSSEKIPTTLPNHLHFHSGTGTIGDWNDSPSYTNYEKSLKYHDEESETLWKLRKAKLLKEAQELAGLKEKLQTKKDYTMSFTLEDVHPDTLKVLYNNAPALDPWVNPPAKEPDALWDQI